MNAPSALRAMIGTWEGAGRASFPTIPVFEYRERLVITLDPSRDAVAYEQRAEIREVGTAAYRPSHWEVGFFRALPDGRVEQINAQNNGRLERLVLTVAPEPGGWRLAGEATGHYNDPRMVGASRLWVLAGDHLTYELDMRTTAVPGATPHLRATLSRVSGE